MKISPQVISALIGMITGDGAYKSKYRTAREIIIFFNQFGKEKIEGVSFNSRGKYVEACLVHLNDTPTMKNVISATLDARDYDDCDTDIRDTVSYLNSLLKYDGYEIIQDDLKYVVEEIETKNSSNIKNLIFASNGPKPEIVLKDATTNDIQIVKNAEFCLIYERKLNRNGLLWQELVDWWASTNNLLSQSFSDQANSLYKRLLESVSKNEAEKLLFTSYYFNIKSIYGDTLPALIPQVYLHYDPKTLAELKGEKRLVRQRMDFLLLLPKGKKVVIEIDGQQHFSENDRPSPKLYAEMVAEDRRLKIAGYEVIRFGGYEFINTEEARKKVISFFNELLNIYLENVSK